MKKINKQQGLIGTIILIVIAIIILSYFGVDLKRLWTSDQVQKNLGYVWNLIVKIWTDYLSTPFEYLWGIWVKYFWTPFMDFLNRGTITTK
ncbi:MAG: hypothetical protein WC027_03010 [Candidatus Paceibacterota bacterium]